MMSLMECTINHGLQLYCIIYKYLYNIQDIILHEQNLAGYYCEYDKKHIIGAFQYQSWYKNSIFSRTDASVIKWFEYIYTHIHRIPDVENLTCSIHKPPISIGRDTPIFHIKNKLLYFDMILNII